MRRYISILMLLALSAGALFAGATYWFGIQAERHYNHLLNQTSRFPYVHLTNEGYERGFIGAKARTTLCIGDPASPVEKDAGRVQFVLAHDIHHGPWPLWRSPLTDVALKPVYAVMETRIELSPETKAGLRQTFGDSQGPAAPMLFTTVPLLGTGKSALVVPAFLYTGGNENQVVIDWKGLTAQVSFAMDFSECTGFLNANGLRVQGKNGYLEIKDAASEFDIHESIKGLYLGDASLAVARVEFKNPTEERGKPFSVRGLKMTTSSQAFEETVDYVAAIRVDQVTAQEKTYGPGDYEMAFRNLDAETLGRLQKAMKDLQSEFPGRSSDEISDMMMSRYSQILPGLLKGSPEIEMTRFSLRMRDGQLQGKAKVVIDGTRASGLNNPLFLLGALTAHAEFSITDHLLESFLESAYLRELNAEKEKDLKELSEEEIKARAAAKGRKRLEGLLARKILILEGKNYKTKADYKGGVVIVNDRPVKLQDFMQ